MDVTSPDDFVEKPVIDIAIEKVGAGDTMAWTINDNAEAELTLTDAAISFFISETQEAVRIERRNIAFSSIRHRIDKVPVNRKGAVPSPSRQPEGGVAGDVA